MFKNSDLFTRIELILIALALALGLLLWWTPLDPWLYLAQRPWDPENWLNPIWREVSRLGQAGTQFMYCLLFALIYAALRWSSKYRPSMLLLPVYYVAGALQVTFSIMFGHTLKRRLMFGGVISVGLVAWQIDRLLFDEDGANLPDAWLPAFESFVRAVYHPVGFEVFSAAVLFAAAGLFLWNFAHGLTLDTYAKPAKKVAWSKVSLLNKLRIFKTGRDLILQGPQASRVWMMAVPLFYNIGMLNFFLKAIIARPRPKHCVYNTGDTLCFPQWFEWQATFHSIPSGHTITTFAILAFALRLYPQFAVPLTAMACVVSYARLGAGTHWASDILIAAVLGYGLAKFLAKSYAVDNAPKVIK